MMHVQRHFGTVPLLLMILMDRKLTKNHGFGEHQKTDFHSRKQAGSRNTASIHSHPTHTFGHAARARVCMSVYGRRMSLGGVAYVRGTALCVGEHVYGRRGGRKRE